VRATPNFILSHSGRSAKSPRHQPSGAVFLTASGGAERGLAVGMILGSRLGVIFAGERQQAIMGHGIAGRVGEATASLGLLS
jgi:hypothetical protein